MLFFFSYLQDSWLKACLLPANTDLKGHDLIHKKPRYFNKVTVWCVLFLLLLSAKGNALQISIYKKKKKENEQSCCLSEKLYCVSADKKRIIHWWRWWGLHAEALERMSGRRAPITLLITICGRNVEFKWVTKQSYGISGVCEAFLQAESLKNSITFFCCKGSATFDIVGLPREVKLGNDELARTLLKGPEDGYIIYIYIYFLFLKHELMQLSHSYIKAHPLIQFGIYCPWRDSEWTRFLKPFIDHTF